MALKIRLIPCLLLKNGLIVRSELFKYHQVIGDPTTQLSRYDSWSVDELIYLDISQEDDYDVRRSDAKIQTLGETSLMGIIREVSTHCFAPLTFGGKIRSLADMRERLANGADKVSINTIAIEQPSMITKGSRAFGSQAIVVSVDVKQHPDGRYEVFKGGRVPTGLDPLTWAQEAEKLGAGEILINSIDRDGTAVGYDTELVKSIVDHTSIPVIALGGAGSWQDMVELAQQTGVSAIAAANIFHFTEMSYKRAKKALAKADVEVRLPYVRSAR